MLVVSSLLLVSLPVVHVAAGGTALAALGTAAGVVGVAGRRWALRNTHGWSLSSPPRAIRRGRGPTTIASGLAPERSDRGERRASWALATADGCDIARCEAFLAAVDDWPRHVWLSIGRAVADVTADRAEAERVLVELVSARGQRVTAWLLRDYVQTAAAVAPDAERAFARRRGPVPFAHAERHAVAAACVAVQRAALAHLLHPWLSARHYTRLTAPMSILPFPNLSAHRRR